MDRRYANPVLVSGERAQPLERIPFEQRVSGTTGLEFDESRLQRLIFETPGLLPIADIEPAFDHALPLALEVPTEVGWIDLLLVNARGYLTIVETKLWRNPEARREVVGQIVDYAQELSTWDVQKLVASAAEADETKIGPTTKELYEYVRTNSEDLQEQEFLDSLAVSLREGRVLLLIAGDGIRENVESIAEFLDRFPQLHFKLALVELLLYELKSDLLIVPQVLMRTREIERAVVRDNTSEGTDISVDLPSEGPETERRRTLTETDYLRLLPEHARGPVAAFLSQMALVDGALDWHSLGPKVRVARRERGPAVIVSMDDYQLWVRYGELQGIPREPSIRAGERLRKAGASANKTWHTVTWTAHDADQIEAVLSICRDLVTELVRAIEEETNSS